MAFGLSIRGMCAARASATTSSVLNAAEPNATLFGVLLCLPKAPAVPDLWAALGQATACHMYPQDTHVVGCEAQ